VGSQVMTRNPVAGQRKGLQPCNLVIGARDGSIAGDPRYRSLCVRGLAGDSSQRAAGKITDGELVALGVAQAATGLNSDRQFLGVVGRLLPGFFPHLPDQSQYNRRLRRLTPHIATVQLQVAALVAEGRIRLADGTLISCANYAGCASKSEFAPHAGYGYCPSKSLFVWGMRLVLESDVKGVPTGYDLVPAGAKEYEPVYALAEPGSLLFCDKGLWGREFRSSMELIDVELITPSKHKLGQRPPAEVAKARIRLVIESVISNLKRQMRLEDHLAKTSPGSRSGSPSAYSRSRSASSATSSSDAPHGRSSHMTGAEPTSGL
jgi:DDE family transposase